MTKVFKKKLKKLPGFSPQEEGKGQKSGEGSRQSEGKKGRKWR
jgi:hypothetical protein